MAVFPWERAGLREAVAPSHPTSSHPMPTTGTAPQHGQGVGNSHPWQGPRCRPHGQPPPRPTSDTTDLALAELGGTREAARWEETQGKTAPRAPLLSTLGAGDQRRPGRGRVRDSQGRHGVPGMAMISQGWLQCPGSNCGVPGMAVVSQGWPWYPKPARSPRAGYGISGVSALS